MRSLSVEHHTRIADIAQRHGFSVPATLAMLDALIKGNGTMAQFNDPEFAGPGQWMKGGMTMVSDMFNNRLKARVDALCSDLSEALANEPGLIRGGSFQSQTQDSGRVSGSEQGRGRSAGDGSAPTASIFVPPTPGGSTNGGLPSWACQHRRARRARYATDALGVGWPSTSVPSPCSTPSTIESRGSRSSKPSAARSPSPASMG